MSFRCAVVVIQAAGLSGMPRAGQVASADANASCIASSARSNDPAMRISVAMMRPDSSRKTDSTAVRASTSNALHLVDRPDLDAPLAALTRGRDFSRPLDRVVEIAALDDVIAGELFLRLRARTVGDDGLTASSANRRGGVGRLQRIGASQHAAAASLVHHRVVLRRGG